MRQGNYLGQNYGVVIGVTDGEIRLKELVQDGAGDWTERSSTLQLIQPDAAKYTGSEEDERVRLAQHRIGSAGERPARAFVWLAAALALAVAGAAFGAGRNSIDALTVSKGSSGNTIVRFTLKIAARQSACRLRDREPAADRARFPRHRQRRSAATQRMIDDPAVRSLNVVQAGQPHARRVQPQQAADVLDAGRRQRGDRHAVRPERAARRQDAGRRALRRGASGRRRARAARRRLPPRRRTARGASSSTCPTTRPASTSASRART